MASETDLIGRLRRHLRRRYRVELDEVEPTDTPGFWRKGEPCGGRGECSSPLHGTLFNEGPIRHTVSFYNRTRDDLGRFLSPYLAWREDRERRGMPRTAEPTATGEGADDGHD